MLPSQWAIPDVPTRDGAAHRWQLNWPRSPAWVWPRARRDGPSRPKTGRPPRVLAFCKRTPGLTGYYSAPLITIAREICFTLRTLEHVIFATGWSPAYPRTTVRHTGGNDDYTEQARPAVIGIKGRPPSMAKPASMNGSWELSGILLGAAAACLFRRTYALSEG